MIQIFFAVSPLLLSPPVNGDCWCHFGTNLVKLKNHPSKHSSCASKLNISNFYLLCWLIIVQIFVNVCNLFHFSSLNLLHLDKLQMQLY